MKQSKILISLLVVALFSVAVMAVSPVSAQNGTDEPAPTSTTDEDSTSSETEVQKRGAARERLEQIRSHAKSELVEKRTGKVEKTLEKRQKLCENREKAVNNKVRAFGNAASKHLERLDGVFVKLQAYQTEKNLKVDNYQALVDAATAKQTAATSAVAALKSVAVNIDCTSTDPASSLSVVKTAAKEARTALKDYRKALKEIVVAFAQANKTDESSTEGGE